MSTATALKKTLRGRVRALLKANPQGMTLRALGEALEEPWDGGRNRTVLGDCLSNLVQRFDVKRTPAQAGERSRWWHPDDVWTLVLDRQAPPIAHGRWKGGIRA